jgi:hypothetical protein
MRLISIDKKAPNMGLFSYKKSRYFSKKGLSFAILGNN